MRVNSPFSWIVGAVVACGLYLFLAFNGSPLLSPSVSDSDTGSEAQCGEVRGSYYDEGSAFSTISEEVQYSPPDTGSTVTGPACGKDTNNCSIYCPVGYKCGGGMLCCPPGTTYGKTGNLELCEPDCQKGQTKCSQYCCDDATQKCESQVSLLGIPKVASCVPKNGKCDVSKSETPCEDKDRHLVGCCAPTQKCDTQTKPTGLLFPRTVTVSGCTSNSCPQGQTLISGGRFYAGYNICCVSGFVNANGMPACT